MKSYPVCFVIFLCLMVADVFFFTIRNAMLANLEPDESVRTKDFILLAVHAVFISLELIDILWCICRTFWGEGMFWRRILMLLKFNFFFWCAHIGLTVFITIFESFILPPVTQKRPWGAPTYILLQIADIVLMIFFFLSSVFVFGVLSEKSLYPPYSMQVSPDQGRGRVRLPFSRGMGPLHPNKQARWDSEETRATIIPTSAATGAVSRSPAPFGLRSPTLHQQDLPSFSRRHRSHSPSISHTMGSATGDTADTTSIGTQHDYGQTPPRTYRSNGKAAHNDESLHLPGQTQTVSIADAAVESGSPYASAARRRVGVKERVSFYHPPQNESYYLTQGKGGRLQDESESGSPQQRQQPFSSRSSPPPMTRGDLRSALKAMTPLEMPKPIAQRETVELLSRGAPRSIESATGSRQEGKKGVIV